jgi:hypothetical protein
MAQAPERAGRGAVGRGARGGRGRPNQLQAEIEGEVEEPPLAPVAPEPGFLATLVAFRFNPDAIQGMTNNGLLSTHDLIGLTVRDIKKIMKIIRIGPPGVVVPYLAEKNLTILTYWVNRRNRLQESIDPVLFNTEELEAYSKLMNAEAKDKDDSDVKPPEKFKATSKWKPFKEGVIAYFLVFDHLKSWTLEGPAWTWMRQHNNSRNGRAAWQALLFHYEGDAERDRVSERRSIFCHKQRSIPRTTEKILI